MQIGPVRSPVAAALEARSAVIAEACEHAPQRLGAVVEQRSTRVVLEPGERSPGPRAVQQHVADHAARPRDRLQRQEGDARKLDAGDVAVRTPEQLVAAADREKGGVALDRRSQRVRLAGEVVGNELLLAVLTAADVVEVDLARGHRVAQPDRRDLELVAAPPRPLGEHGDVAAVGVDVQVVRIQMTDADSHAAASQ